MSTATELEDTNVNGLLNVALLAQEALPTVPDSSSFFTELDSGAKAGLAFMGIVAVTVIVITLWSIAWNFGHSMHRQRLEADLKRDMLDRGMSAEEVAKVIEATAPQGVAERWVASKNK